MFLKTLKNQLRQKTYQRAISYIRKTLAPLNAHVVCKAYNFNHYCFFNVANHLVELKGWLNPKTEQVDSKLWSDKPTFVLCVDRLTGDVFLHCLLAVSYYGSVILYHEVTLGYLHSRYDYYYISQLPGELSAIDVNFDNARIDFLTKIGTPFWYRFFVEPNELI